MKKIATVGWCFYPGIGLHLAFVLTGKNIKGGKKKFFLYLPCILILILAIYWFPPLVKKPDSLYDVYSMLSLLVTLSYIGMSIIMIYIWGKKSKSIKEKKQSKLIVFTGFASYILGVIFHNILPLFNIKTYFIGQILGLIWAYGVYYAITRYKFLNLTSSYAAESIVGKIKDMIVLLDTENCIIYFNNQFGNVLGYNHNDIYGKHYLTIFDKDFSLSEKKQENLCIPINKEMIPCDVLSTKIYDKDGDFIGTILIINDIRETKKLRNEIIERKNAETSLRNLLDNSGQGFLSFSENLIIHKEYSEFCKKIFGEELCKKTFPEILYKENKIQNSNFGIILLDSFKTKNLQQLPDFAIVKGKYIGLEYKFVCANNKQNIMVILTDVTKEVKLRRKIEGILLGNRTSYNLLIQNARDSILLHRDGKLIFVNESAAKILGFIRPEELEGKDLYDLTPVDLREYIKEKYDEVYEKKDKILSFRGKCRKKDGQIIEVEYKSTYFMYDGKSTILSIIRDITQEKQIEKLKKEAKKNKKILEETLENNKVITEFFTNVSHELKTPLNVIFTATQTLMMYENNEITIEKRKHYYLMIKQNCYRLTRLINNLLDISRIDSGFIKSDFKNSNIIQIIEDVSLSVVPHLESKGIKLIFDCNVEERIMAIDVDKIERIILNLISNSIKFTDRGGNISVTVFDRGDIVDIYIKDTGIGIPLDKLQIIFERFNQVDKTLSRNREGSGIGLYLVKSFVEIHEGSISVDSILGQGSEFKITLPVRLIEETQEDEKLKEVNIERINIEFSDIYK
ncbi:MAG: PAS domain S-box protein [Clostridiaceae bacterium]